MSTRSLVSVARLTAAIGLLLVGPAYAQKAAYDLGAVGKRLSKDSLLHRLTYDVVSVNGSFSLLIPPVTKGPGANDPARLERIQAFYAPWLAALDESFLRNFRDPLRLLPQDASGKQGAHVVVILESQRQYTGVLKRHRKNALYETFALRMPAEDIVVSFHDRNTSRQPAHWKRYPVLRNAALNLFEQHASAPETAMGELWLMQGLATYLSSHGEGGPQQLATPPPHAAAIKRFGKLAENPDEIDAALLSLPELVAVRDSAGFVHTMRTRYSNARLPAPPHDGTADLFNAQAALWAHFFQQGAEGAHAPGLGRYLTRVLGGEGGEALLANSLGVAQLSELDAPFRTYVSGLLGGVEIPGASPVIIAGEEGPTRRPVTPDLIVEPQDVEGYLSLALGEARIGQLDASLATIAAGKAALGAAGDQERLEREGARLKTLHATREAFFNALAGSKRRLKIDRKNVKISARVSSYADGVLHLESSKSGVRQVAVQEITPRILLDNISRDVTDFGPAWVHPYALLLAGDGSWTKHLRADSDEMAALKEDGERELLRLLMFGEAAARLNALAFKRVPDDGEGAQQLVEEIASLLERHGPVRPVKAKLPALRALAKEALQATFRATGVEGMLAGATEKLGGDRVRITYDFDDEAEAGDFRIAPDYLAARRNPSFRTLPESESSLKINAGNWEGQGSVCYSHLLPLEAPMSISYDLLYGRAAAGKGLLSNVWIGLCDDGEESYIMGMDIFDLEVFDKASNAVRTSYEDGARIIKPAASYQIKLRHDGQTISLWVAGKKVRELEARPRLSGRMFVLVHSEVMVAIKHMEIEGRLTADMQTAARQRYVREQLHAMGLD